MLIHRNTLKALGYATTTDPSSYHLSSILIEPDGAAVATDGHMLLRATQRQPTPAAEFPSKGLPEHHPLTGAVLLPATAAAKLVKSTPAKTSLSVLEHILIGLDAEGAPYAAATDLELPLVAPLKANGDEATFPTYTKQIPPPDRPHLTVYLAGDLLTKLAQAAKAVSRAGQGTKGAIRFEIPTEADCYSKGDDPTLQHAIRVVIRGEDGVEIVGAIMPCMV